MATIQHFPRTKNGVTLLGGGHVSAEILSQTLTQAPDLIGVDGGADRALGFGHKPLAVIGDLDSVSVSAKETIGASRVVETPDQNRTDFDKALDLVDAPVILCVGFTGERLDHELACYSVLVRQPAKPAIIVGDVDICFHLGKSIKLNLPIGARISLFPMAPVVVYGSGLKWPVEGLEMAPWGQIGTSNEVCEPSVTLSADGAGLLVILPRSFLPQVIEKLWQG